MSNLLILHKTSGGEVLTSCQLSGCQRFELVALAKCQVLTACEQQVPRLGLKSSLGMTALAEAESERRRAEARGLNADCRMLLSLSSSSRLPCRRRTPLSAY